MRLKHARTLITGRPGIGKTTLVRKVLESLGPVNAAGFFTAEIKEEGRRVGFELQGLHGARRILSHVGISGPHRVGKYGVDVAGFEEFLANLDLLGPGIDLAVIDEIGKMELLSQRFRNLVIELLDTGKPVLATIALKGGDFVRQVKRRNDVFLVEITPHNRNGLLTDIVNRSGSRG